MIATTLYGGLGNQMFLYAMSRAMSLRNHVPMAFNLNTGFDRDSVYKRFLELDKFCLDLPIAPLETFDFPFGHFIERVSCKIGRHMLLPNYKYVREPFSDFHYLPQLVEGSYKNIYLEGYWQDPRYFDDCIETLRKDFTLKVSLPEEVGQEMNHLLAFQRPLVMVGIRRYQEAIGQPTRLKVCSANYYNKAMEYMVEVLTNPIFVVFGQDRQWAIDNLDAKFEKYFVEEKKGALSAVSDLFLMRNCQHAIISNSTYYWWGAWLQKERQEDHIVVCANNFINPCTPCKEWKIIDA